MKIESHASLRDFNGLRLESYADELIHVEQPTDLAAALATSAPCTILGDGTNVVLKPHVEGRVVRLLFKSIKVERQCNERARVYVDAGVNWHELVRYTLAQGISGLENLALIPGSVGAAPFQNIGAYGMELHEVCESVSVFDRVSNEFKVLSADECNFGYRDSSFKSTKRGKYVICGVTLGLGGGCLNTTYRDVAEAVGPKPHRSMTATQIAEAVIRIRRRKLPDIRRVPNVGSFFKNPCLSEASFAELRAKINIDGFRERDGVKVSAARLIDSAGGKKASVGDATVWPRQPLVLVNRGRAKARDVLALAARIADEVHRRYDVLLELEPEVIGSD
ncbi:MAG: UDP-N-acetylmuramate dehydrogenase [Gammaproteobacteria bacterium]|nr:UDP-N-acetylmuramate dehydrogenase [Gammaproteobacteria bacterium]